MPDECDGDMAEMIRERGWETFTDHPDPACIAIVKEFYANAQDTPECTVMVRGAIVSFSRAVINDYYNLQGYDKCQYASLKPDYDKIIQELCQPGTEWKRNAHNGRVKSFPGKNLSRYGKIWYAFLCAKLMPSTHVGDVTWERVIGLLYAIITDLKIDVGWVIEASIKKKLKGATSSGLPHPSLITELCKRAGSKWGVAEPLQPPTTLLNHQLIQRYQEWRGGQSQPRGLGFIIPQQAVEEPPTTTAAPSTSAGTSTPDLGRRIRRLEHRVDTLDDQLHRIALRQGESHVYNTRFNTALVAYFQRLNPSVELGNFPIPQGLSEFPPPADESEEDDDTEADEEDDEEIDHDN